MHVGRIDDAIAPLETVKRLEPQAARINLVLAYYLRGRFGDALAVADAMLIHAPAHIGLNVLRAALQVELGDLDEARRAAGEVRRQSPEFRVEQWGRWFTRPEHVSRLHDSLRKAGL